MTAPRPLQEMPIIPSRRSGVTVLCAHAFLAILVGLALRLLFVFRFSISTDDSETYLQLARNWADHHIYGLWLNGQLIPTDLRMPGYPAFLAGVAMLFRRSTQAIVLSQAVLDLGTCFLAAALAAALVQGPARRRVAIATLWLTATCPFPANYSAAVLTETLVTFLATASLMCFATSLSRKTDEPNLVIFGWRLTPLVLFWLGAFLTGVATLVRPEMPLLLAVAMIIYILRWWKAWGLGRVILACAAVAGSFLIPLIPWAARNLVTLHEVQFLAPRYVILPGEYAPVGYYAWTGTWLSRYRDVYLNVWKIGEEQVDMEDLPEGAFDSRQEKAEIAGIFARYNTSQELDISPEMDREFARIAHERTQRHPLRTYISVPFQRALTIWFTPRTELLPIDGKFWPIPEVWQDSPANFLTTAGLGALGYVYIVLAIGGIGYAWRTASTQSAVSGVINVPNLWGIALIAGYLIARTAFLTTVEAPEPRYVVSCYPVVLAMAALLWMGKTSRN